ncbi:PhzF family phenazine biosynthesis protein [Wolbachia endosymbiont of Ctenocephalides felis wCfeJ]|uniref:PhzF family phenazine biosynthesis protein n=1 Tax=Wolbachia endosymbiont of Ctenocephalides felis wCfeJ TaxID=2732594 RepID=UPI0014462ECB|nr:PhzF family phenazine biosynthesis isomerase [Wolbachia endosymbiont of Ctenocephalides felis wCfeJ]
MTIIKVNVFTRSTFTGNPAAVVIEFSGNSQQMQLLAKKLNFPATVFILPSKSNKVVAQLRFFAPATELSMCGHGILAAASYLFRDKTEGKLVIETLENKIVKIEKRHDGLLQFTSTRAQRLDINIDDKEIRGLLGLPSSLLIKSDNPYCVASIGSPKLLVPIISRQTLLTIKPDFLGITDWSIKNDVNGIYAYTSDTVDTGSHFHARSFNPNSGNDEDAATGVAAAALASVYSDETAKLSDVIIEQGDCIGKKSRIVVTVNEELLKIGGYAAIDGPILQN